MIGMDDFIWTETVLRREAKLERLIENGATSDEIETAMLLLITPQGVTMSPVVSKALAVLRERGYL